MTNPASQAIYNQYITYFTAGNAYIHDIDSLPPGTAPGQRDAPNTVADRATIVAQQTLLGSVYQADYSTATLAQFISDCAPIESAELSAYNDAMSGGNPNTQQIQADLSSATNIASQLSTAITGDQTPMGSVAGFQTQLNTLQTQINALPDGPAKTKAQADFSTATASLALLVANIGDAQSAFTNLQSELAQLQTAGTGILAQLQTLAALTNPTPADVTAANTLLATAQTMLSDLQTFQNGLMATVSANVATVQTDIKVVQTDIQPTPPPPAPGTVEHSCWYIDWTTWDFPIPQGVDTVNLFVGELTLVNGVPTLGGFGNMDLTQLQTFAAACHSQVPPIAVKVSVGGGGGSYDNCWDALTTDNVGSFAQMLVDFCSANGVDGVDFDYEEYKSAAQETLVGNLILKFKQLNPALRTSLCTNAGFGPSYPWQPVVTAILDGAKDPVTGTCAVDKLNVMSYYQDLSDEEGWVTGWAGWLATNYGFAPSQVVVGIDDFDAHAYDIGQFSQWAGTQGFSTGYWAWNPATVSQSNQSALEILSSYNPTFFKRIRLAVSRVLSAIGRPFYKGINYIYSLITGSTHSETRRTLKRTKGERLGDANMYYSRAPRIVPTAPLMAARYEVESDPREVDEVPYLPPSAPLMEGLQRRKSIDEDPSEEIAGDINPQ